MFIKIFQWNRLLNIIFYNILDTFIIWVLDYYTFGQRFILFFRSQLLNLQKCESSVFLALGMKADNPVVTDQCPKIINSLLNFRCRIGFVVDKRLKYFGIFFNLSIKPGCAYLNVWNTTCISVAVTVQCPNANFKFAVSNSAQKARFCKRSENTQCRNRYNEYCRFRSDTN